MNASGKVFCASILLATAVCLMSLASCRDSAGVGPFQGLPVDPAMPADCILAAGEARSGDTVTVALFDRVRPVDVSDPRSISAEIVFSHLYETLIDIDCAGTVRPSLAESWRSYRGGRRFVFTIRRRARFSDGSPVRPEDVIRSWPVAPAGIDTFFASGEREITVTFEDGQDGPPVLLASPSLAVFKSVRGDSYAAGTGAYRVAETGYAPFDVKRELILVPVSPGNGPVILFIMSEPSSARDLLESGTDLMVTTDPSVIAYASVHGDYRDIPLFWRDTYVLLSTSRINTLRWGRDVAGIAEGFAVRLAADAVRADARGCEGGCWWEGLHGPCLDGSDNGSSPLALRGADPALHRRGILFDLSDPVARDLADRLVALSAARPPASEDAASIFEMIPGLSTGNLPFALGLGPYRLAESMRRGDDFAYIVRLPSRTVSPCRTLSSLVKSAPYLAGLGEGFDDAILPLVETRPHLIVRNGGATVNLDIRGRIRIRPPLSRRETGERVGER